MSIALGRRRRHVPEQPSDDLQAETARNKPLGVRRDKAALSSGCEAHPAIRSWADQLACDPADYGEGQRPYVADAEGLSRFFGNRSTAVVR